jgi:hypothetical protein
VRGKRMNGEGRKNKERREKKMKEIMEGKENEE